VARFFSSFSHWGIADCSSFSLAATIPLSPEVRFQSSCPIVGRGRRSPGVMLSVRCSTSLQALDWAFAPR